LLRARDELRLIAWIVVPLAAAILLRAYVPFRFEAVIAAPFALWIARRKPALIPATALLAMLTVWSILGIFDHASRPADPYRDAATWLATHVPPTETVAASGYLYLETLMSGRKHVVALPQEQAQHPGWRALPPREGLPTPAGTFLWIGERGAPELAIVARAGRSVEPLYINPRAMVARIR
jgi:hypothetical protein